MRPRTLLVYLSLLPLSACTRSCKEYDNADAFDRAALPPYSDTGAGTLGCRLGPQTWTVLGSHYQNRPGYPWEPNGIRVEAMYSRPKLLAATGQMTGVRDSHPFYDVQIILVFQPTDTLGGLRLLGSDTARVAGARPHEYMAATNFLTLRNDYASRSQRPVRLRVRKLDRQQRIVSGTFDGCLYGGPGGHDSLTVADGRFDLKY